MHTGEVSFQHRLLCGIYQFAIVIDTANTANSCVKLLQLVWATCLGHCHDTVGMLSGVGSPCCAKFSSSHPQSCSNCEPISANSGREHAGLSGSSAPRSLTKARVLSSSGPMQIQMLTSKNSQRITRGVCSCTFNCKLSAPLP